MKRDENSQHVPKYSVVFHGEKRNSYCLVVPVINEGARIQSFLGRLKAMELSSIVDILVVDGGSTDGSLDERFLKSQGVLTLIEKTDEGGLSAQLLCAYSYALGVDYRGIITIDGNDKDNPDAIPIFLRHLEAGFDFVQASRFLPDGKAVNTPWLRDLAIRFIHAPLLSLFSGFRWTDTTQGFRGYSSRMLKSERIAPFRRTFRNYELLAYLSYSAPRNNFACVEVPSTRIYPQGAVPTKISGIVGNWRIFATLIKACLGHYNPRGDRNEKI